MGDLIRLDELANVLREQSIYVVWLMVNEDRPGRPCANLALPEKHVVIDVSAMSRLRVLQVAIVADSMLFGALN